MSNDNKIKQVLTGWYRQLDVPLLLLLCTITYSSLLVKFAGLILVFVLRPDFRFKAGKGRLPLFYPAMIVIGLIYCLTHYNTLTQNYTLAALLSMLFWMVSFLTAHQLMLSVERSGSARAANTVTFFLLLNAAVSLAAIGAIMLETHTINPFMYAGMNYHYHVSTGDHILGIFRDVSTTNSCIMLLGFVFFFFRGKYGYSILSLLIVLLTTSNINNILLLALCAGMLLFARTRLTRTLVFCFLSMILFFLVKVTPNNLRYTLEKFHATALIGDLPTENSELRIQHAEEEAENNTTAARYDSELARENNIFREITIKEALYREKKKMEDISADSEFIRQQQASFRHNLVFSEKIYGDSLRSCTDNPSLQHKPGKWIAFDQTVRYWTQNFGHFLIGAGPGNFSSKVAFKASGFGIFGNYPSRYQRITPTFKDNHLKVLTYFFIQPPDKHSVMNTPFSVYNQLAGEYGLAGLLAFVFLYVCYFLRRYSRLSYGKLLIPVVLLMLATDYWFEQLSVVVIFELLLFIDMKKNETDSSTLKKFAPSHDD